MTDLSMPARPGNTVPEPSNLAVAARVAQILLAEYEGIDHSDLLALDRAYAGLCETLRILLRHIGAEAARRSVDAQFPVVAAFLAAERGEQR